MALLVVLAAKPDTLRRRGDLIDDVWPDGSGGDESLSRLISLLRKAFASDHGLDTIVATVPKLGYRLDAAISAVPAAPDMPPNISAHKPLESLNSGPQTQNGENRPRWIYAALSLGLVVALAALGAFLIGPGGGTDSGSRSPSNNSQPSIAVLPIESIAGAADRSFLAEGMTRDLTAALSRVSNARVAPYSSARLLAGKAINGAQAAKDLNVQYIISGSLAQQGGQLVLRVDLTDTKARQQIWSKRFTEPLANFFDLQDHVVQEIATSIFSEIQASQIARLGEKDEFNLSVYELIQTAESERFTYGRAAAQRIISHLERAVEIDPDNYSASAALAIQLAQSVISGYSDDPKRDVPLALKYLVELRAKAPRDPQVLTSTAMVQYYINGDMAQAKRLLEQSLAINPNEPHGAVVLGLIECYSGQAEEGLTLIEHSEARAPRDPRYGIWAWFRGACQTTTRDYQRAASAAEEAIDRNPNYPAFYYALANFECLLGNENAARKAILQSKQVDPEFGQDDYERLISTAGYPGTPVMSRNQVFQNMRACLRVNAR